MLYALRDAIARLNFACRVVVHTECSYVAAAITQRWPEAWQRNGWKNSHGGEARDAVLWSLILQDIEDSGHELEAEGGKHEYSQWMAWNMPLARAYKDTFFKLPKE